LEELQLAETKNIIQQTKKGYKKEYCGCEICPSSIFMFFSLNTDNEA
jgi:hypothetical protein